MITAVASNIVKNHEDAAKQLGITHPTLYQWAKAAWFPETGKTADGWDVTAIGEARDALNLKGSERSNQARDVKIATDEEKLLSIQLKNEKDSLANAQLRGELVPRQGFELFAATLLTELSDWVSQVPDIVEQDVPKKYRSKLVKRIRGEFDSKRAQTAATLARFARDLDAESLVDGEG